MDKFQAVHFILGNNYITTRRTGASLGNIAKSMLQEEIRNSGRAKAHYTHDPIPEGYQGDWRLSSEGSDLDRMIQTDCCKVSKRSEATDGFDLVTKGSRAQRMIFYRGFRASDPTRGYARMGYELHAESSLNWSGYMAKLALGTTDKASREMATEIVDTLKDLGYDAPAIHDLLRDKRALSFVLQADAPSARIESELEISDEILPEKAVHSFALGIEDGGHLSRPLQMLLDEVKILGRAGLANLAQKCMKKGKFAKTSGDWRYERLSNKEQTSFWTIRGYRRDRLALRHTRTGSSWINRAKDLERVGQLNPLKRAQIQKGWFANEALFNKVDSDVLWGIIKGGQPPKAVVSEVVPQAAAVAEVDWIVVNNNRRRRKACTDEHKPLGFTAAVLTETVDKMSEVQHLRFQARRFYNSANFTEWAKLADKANRMERKSKKQL
jgi:hypothetical protein